MAGRTFWRIVRTNPPSEADFLSNEAKGLHPRDDDAETLRLWSGIPAFATLTQARRMARRVPSLGDFVAELSIPDDPAVRIERTLGRGHHTLWGDANRLLTSVVRVEPVEGQANGDRGSE
jgi:hypothetical protein